MTDGSVTGTGSYARGAMASSPLSPADFSATVSAIATAFGDPTRRDIYLWARDVDDGVTAAETAERFELHPNVARHHLEKLVAGGYLEVSTERAAPAGAGRPSKRYRMAADTELGHLELDGSEAEKRAAYSAKERDDLSWEQWAQRLQRFYAHIEFIFSPDLLVVGGGVSKHHEKFLPLLDLATPIVPATHRNNAGILGAASLARHEAVATA